MELLDPLLTRAGVIGLAVIGAALAMAGSYWKFRGGGIAATVLHWGGYACTGVSIVLFIVIGYRGGYT